jgi:hypothetical protein
MLVEGRVFGMVGSIFSLLSHIYSSSPTSKSNFLFVSYVSPSIRLALGILLLSTTLCRTYSCSQLLGRKNWNIPKHLASFTFIKLPSGSTQLTLSNPNSSTTFLKVNLTPFKYIPAIPFSTNSAKYVGLDLRLAQPPLPSGSETKDVSKSGEEEGEEFLCGTEEWKVAMPEIWGKAMGCWADVDFEPSSTSSTTAQESTPLLAGVDEDVVDDGGEKGWWPKYRPWRVGLFIEEGSMNFRDVEIEGVTT